MSQPLSTSNNPQKLFTSRGSTAVRVQGAGSGQAPLQLLNIQASKNGYVYAYLSNESPVDVFFDNLQVVHTRGPLLEGTHYYPYGLKIAAISSRKAGDAREGKLDNQHLYQGAYAELDEEIGWQDFALRNYDAQIGRWVQQDPYQEFASPYVGMGNDPVNYIDPDGGSIINYFGDAFANHLADAVIGAAIGGIVGGREGAAKGAAIGLGAGFVPWSEVGATFTDASNWVNKFASSIFTSNEWLELTKSALTLLVDKYSNRIFANSGQKDNYIGNMFERNFHIWVSTAQAMPFIGGTNIFNAYHANTAPDEMDDGNGSTIPGHSSRSYVIVDGKMTVFETIGVGGPDKIIPHIDAGWFEVKASDKVVSKSSYNYQIQYEIEALAYFNPLAAKAGVAQYHIVTTANGAVGNGVYSFAYAKGINVFNWRPQYKVKNGRPEIRFGYEVSKRDSKNRPVLRKFFTSYYYYGGTQMTF